MDDQEERIHRTWIQLLLDTGNIDLAALAVDFGLKFLRNDGYIFGIVLEVPTHYYYVIRDEKKRGILTSLLYEVSEGNIIDPDNTPASLIDGAISFQVQLLDVEKEWRDVVKSLIVNVKSPNHATITEKVFSREGKQPYLYNEMKFGSQAEIRIAQEFERRGVLFFPLPLAVRHETGVLWKDHREVDFLVCVDGIWGILEVAFHQGRYEKDSEKDVWFQKSGILCIRHYPAERCYKNASEVVDEFLMILGKHKR